MENGIVMSHLAPHGHYQNLMLLTMRCHFLYIYGLHFGSTLTRLTSGLAVSKTFLTLMCTYNYVKMKDPMLCTKWNTSGSNIVLGDARYQLSDSGSSF